MFRAISFFIIVLAANTTFGQLTKPIQFREETFDFGTVAEEGGPVEHEFVFTNTSDRAIRILNVQPSCGCTTPAWSKDVIAIGKTGYVKAVFDPKSRPGYFTKTLSVTTDFDATPIVLQIKGTVNASGAAEALNEFPHALGNMKFKHTSFKLGRVFHKDEWTVRDFQVVNAGMKAITLTKVVGPSYIKIDMTPKLIPAGGIGNIKVSYNGKLKGKYGYQSDNVELHTDDELSPVKSFSVYATLEDDFSTLSPEELSKAPQVRVGATELDFGRFNQGSTSERELPVSNVGKRELQIKSLQGNCNCITAHAAKETLKPGETTTIKLTFTADRSGTQQKALTIYTNDPQNPVVRVWLKAYGY
ncbi:DUF1573 domain-containing protein [Pseudochryseolinea flava]|uniref:DUF1573 domain-containing protein n=1 Tax=Pseudochryseolinea flava TaxID=2059302 RepID=A0A364Y0J0_9BACT|nr:DUF1573 domain-containing protein [Pseudochryseolinea flava]RAV99604.1 DUF1573 domain-containing protein [Pseudochryseolinea flava]